MERWEMRVVIWTTSFLSLQIVGAMREGPLVEATDDMTLFGQPLFRARITTWADLGMSTSKLGLKCDPERPQEACGTELVCWKGLCMHCAKDRQCPDHHFCKMEMNGQNICTKVESHVWGEVVSDPWEFLCSVLIFLSSALAAAAGMGGGGMFVPLLVLFSGLRAPLAVPLSQVMILGSSVVNLTVFIAQRHPNNYYQAKIDYNIVVLLEPMLCAGVTLGVLVHQLSPQWLLMVLLCATLGLALWRTSLKAFEQRRKENASTSNSTPDNDTAWWTSFSHYTEEVQDLTNSNFRAISAIIVIWALVFAFSLHNLAVCSSSYVIYLSLVLILLSVITWLVSNYALRAEMASKRSQWADAEHAELTPTDRSSVRGANAVDWSAPGTSWKLALMALGAGLLGGLLGLGGGMLMSPLLLEIGLHSEAVQATTALFVFLSSSLATVQYALLSSNVYVWDYVVWYVSITLMATVLGQWACNAYVRRHKRYSVITFSIVAVTGFSLIALVIVGTMQVMDDFRANAPMGFSVDRLCNGEGVGIIAVDVMPAQPYPELPWSTFER